MIPPSPPDSPPLGGFFGPHPAAPVAALATLAAGAGVVALCPFTWFAPRHIPVYTILLLGILGLFLILRFRTGPFLFVVVAVALPFWRIGGWRSLAAWDPAVLLDSRTIALAAFLAAFLDASHRLIFLSCGFDAHDRGFKPAGGAEPDAGGRRVVIGSLVAAATGALAAILFGEIGAAATAGNPHPPLAIATAILGATLALALLAGAALAVSRVSSMTPLEARAFLQRTLWVSLLRERFFLARLVARARRRALKRSLRTGRLGP